MLDLERHPAESLAAVDAAAGVWLTYGELRSRVAADAERKRGRKRLAFLQPRNDTATLIDYLGWLEAGHCVALIDANLHPDLLRTLHDVYRVDLDIDIHPECSLLLTTSGSTGSPKFVRLTRGNIESNAASIAEALGIPSQHRAITSLPFHYSYGLSVIHSHLKRGASLVMTGEGLTSREFWGTIRRHECTSFAGVPYSYQVLKRLDINKLDVPSLKVLTQAGGKLSEDLISHFYQVMRARGGEFFPMYGQTEATARIAVRGRAIPGGRIEIDNGELIYHGPNVGMGYATCREDLARGDEWNGRLATGDLAAMSSDGLVTILGRAKRDAKINGVRTNLDEVESMLRPFGTVAVVFRDDQLRVFVESDTEGGDPAADRLARCQTELMQKLRLHPKSISCRSIEKLPIQSSGKVDYQALSAA